jgi:hypothetical protein
MYNPFDLAKQNHQTKIWDTSWISWFLQEHLRHASMALMVRTSRAESNMAMSQADGKNLGNPPAGAFFWRHIVWVHADVDMCIEYIHIQSFSTDIPHTGWSNT